jgi:hypothetical protein
MKLKTIEQQIVSKADEELNERIKKGTEYIHNNIDWHKSVTWEPSPPDSLHMKKITATPGECLMLLRQHLFERLHEGARQAAVNNLLKKVDQLVDAVHDLGLQREEDEETPDTP